MKKIAVIGGGITGVTTAYALAKRGFSVTLFEKHRYAAMETSFANGGQLSASNAEVWNHWSTLLKGLKWMLKSDAPLLVSPKPSWHKISWFAEFIATIPNYRSNTIETTRLAIAARKHLLGWAEQEGIDFDLKKEGILHIYRDKASFDHAGRVSKLLAEGGLSRRAVTPEEMRVLEPTLAGKYYGGYFTESDMTGDNQPPGLGALPSGRHGRVQWLQPRHPRRPHQAIGGLGAALLSRRQHPERHTLGGFAADDAQHAATRWPWALALRFLQYRTRSPRLDAVSHHRRDGGRCGG